MERRFINDATASVGLEERDGETKISGYGAVYFDGSEGSEYQLWEGVRERIMPGAFDRAIQEGDDVRGLFNHDPNMLLGRTASGTMKLEAFSKGLRYTIKPPDTSVARDVIANIRAKNLTGSSFAFTVTDETWRKEDDVTIREIRGVRLYDTGPVTYPAYEGTSVGLRAAGDAVEARSSFDRWQAEEARKAALVEKLAGIAKRAAEIAALE